MFNLKNKVIVITGASGGLGESMAISLSNMGAKIAILDIKEKEGTSLIKKLKTKSRFYKTDVSDEEEIKKAINLIKKDFKSIDVLINNAGIVFQKPISNTSKKELDNLMSINFTSYFLMAKYCLSLMKKGSKIINISSVAGHHASYNAAAYNSSKGAVIQLTKSMAIEYAPKGINVNAVCPGIFLTPMTSDISKSPQMKKTIENSILLKRAAKSEEIQGLIIYLSSDESNYMTGSIITIDGGWTCHL